MTFYRAKYESASKVYVKGARVRAITFSLRTQTKQNAQGDAVEFSGKFTSTEAIKKGALVIGEMGGRMTVYRVASVSIGMAGIYNYYISTEAGQI
jgi:hypothetical protein